MRTLRGAKGSVLGLALRLQRPEGAVGALWTARVAAAGSDGCVRVISNMKTLSTCLFGPRMSTVGILKYCN